MQGRRAGRAILRWGLWILLIWVFVRGVASFLPEPPAQAAEPPAATEAVVEPAGLRAFPAMFAREFLTWDAGGAEDHAVRLRPYLARGMDRQAGWAPSGEDGGQQVEETWVYDVSQASPNGWRVTVAARVTAFRTVVVTEKDQKRTERKQLPPRTIFLSVPVGKTDSGWVVSDYPALVPDPEPGAFSDPARAGRETSDAGGRVKTLLTDYFRAYLSGGELSYYVVPGKQMRSMPSGWTFQQIADLKLLTGDDGVWALADVAVEDSASGTRYLCRYHVQVVERDGRWYITDVWQ